MEQAHTQLIAQLNERILAADNTPLYIKLCNPLWGMSDEQIQQWRALGTRFIQVVPEVQIHTAQDNHDGVLRVGDTQGRLRSWFAQHNASLVVMRGSARFCKTGISPLLNACTKM